MKLEEAIKTIKRAYGSIEFNISFNVRKNGIFLSSTEPLIDSVSSVQKNIPAKLNISESLEFKEVADIPEVHIG